jgi:hypothetical protein
MSDPDTTTWLCTQEQALASIGNVSTGLLQAVQDYIAAATPVIEDITGPIYQRPETRTRNGGKPTIAMPWAFRSVTTVLEDDIPVTDFTPNPSAGILYAGTHSRPRRWNAGWANITVTCVVGLDSTPPNVTSATRALVRFWYQQEHQGSRPAFGDQSVDVVNTPQGFAVPRRVMELLRPNWKAGGFA